MFSFFDFYINLIGFKIGLAVMALTIYTLLSLTALENVGIVAELAGLKRSESRKRAAVLVVERGLE